MRGCCAGHGEHCRRADILVAALGSPEFVKSSMVKPGAVVIDVGVNRIADASAKGGSRLVGDVDFAAVQPIAGKITPNPGGVGPMTIAMLLAKQQRANPRALAQQIIASLELEGLCETPEVAGAGFINFRLTTPLIQQRLSAVADDPMLGVPTATLRAWEERYGVVVAAEAFDGAGGYAALP